MARGKTLARIASVACVLLTAGAFPEEVVGWKELNREDLAGAPGMEVITSIVEVRPGERLARHSHHCVEALYVMQGAMIEIPGKAPMPFPTGATVTSSRDVPHAGFKVVGDQPLLMYTCMRWTRGGRCTSG